MRSFVVLLFITLSAAALLGACGPVRVGFENDSGPADVYVEPDVGPDVAAPTPIFPASPIIDGNAPANAPTLFGSPDSGAAAGGPCLAEPEIGTLIPQAWLRPRFRWIAPKGENLFELRVHVDGQPNDLLVYTTNSSWTMPGAMWTLLSPSGGSQELPMTVTVRGATYNGSQLTAPPALGSSGPVTIAPANANGSIVYWSLAGSVAKLKGFSVGQETVQDLVAVSQISNAQCIGCHTSMPDAVNGDGQFMGITVSTDAGDGAPAFIALRSVKDPTQEPTFLTPSAKTLITRQQQFLPTFTKAHATTGDRVMLSVYNATPWPAGNALIWTDLEATSTAEGVGWGVIARNGDSGNITSPTWSHDGNTIVYASGSSALGGTSQFAGDADLYSVPYGNKAGGTATKLTGANDSAWSAVYPAFSADDKLIAFARMPRGTTMAGSVASEEVWVTDAAGTSATRLAANDPAACTGVTSPGINNSWPHWSPKAVTVGSKTYYWLIFSSWRDDLADGLSQLFVTGVVVEGSKITTYPALYLWNQPPTEHNLTPAWDVFVFVPQ